MKLLATAKPYLARASGGYWASAIAMLLTSTSLAGGLALDDYFHRARAQGLPITGGTRFDLFSFSSGPAEAHRLMEVGVLPWFSHPDLLLSFFRPLASFTHWVDYTYFPHWPLLMHAENVLFYGALVLFATAFYRRLIPVPWIAGLAALAYAFDDAHAVPVGWVANRNAVMAAMFAIASFVAHDRARRDGWKLGAIVGPAWLLAGLLSAEAALGIVAYFVSYALFIDRARWSQRLTALIPYGAVLVGWQIAYRKLGHGAIGSGLYLDPVREPVNFAAAAGKRMIALLVGQFLTPPSDVWTFLPPSLIVPMLAYSVAILGLIGWVLLPLLRRDPVARFFLCGAVMALVPVCATFPSERLLLLVGLGAMGLVAQLLGALSYRAALTPEGGEGAGWRPDARVWGVPARILGWVWLVGHLMISPVVLSVTAAIVVRVPANLINTGVERLRLGPELETQTLVIVNTPDLLRVVYGWILPQDTPHFMPGRGRVLASTMKSVRIERTDAFTLVVRPREGYLSDASSQLVRGDASPMHVGQKVELVGMTAEVTELNERGYPASASFRFTAPLEDPSFRWIAWDGTHFVDLAPPEIGEFRVLGAD